jgi:hypothetical protein
MRTLFSEPLFNTIPSLLWVPFATPIKNTYALKKSQSFIDKSDLHAYPLGAIILLKRFDVIFLYRLNKKEGETDGQRGVS